MSFGPDFMSWGNRLSLEGVRADEMIFEKTVYDPKRVVDVKKRSRL